MRWGSLFFVACLAGGAALAQDPDDRVVGTDRHGRAITVGRLCRELDFRGATFQTGVRLMDRASSLFDLEGADFTDARLQGVDFTGLSLRHADFTRADLTGARLPARTRADRTVTFRDTLDPDGRLIHPVDDWIRASAAAEDPAVAEARGALAHLTASYAEFFRGEGRVGAFQEMGLHSLHGDPRQLTHLRGGAAGDGFAVLCGDGKTLLIVLPDLVSILLAPSPVAWIGPAPAGDLYVAMPATQHLVQFCLGAYTLKDARRGRDVPFEVIAHGQALPTRPELYAPTGKALEFLDLEKGLKYRAALGQDLAAASIASRWPSLQLRTYGYGHGPFGDSMGFQGLAPGVHAFSLIPGRAERGERALKPFLVGLPAQDPGSYRALRLRSGRIWVHLDGSLQWLDPVAIQKGTLDTGKRLTQPALTEGPDGCLWFTDPEGGRLGRVDPAGKLTWTALPKGSRPAQLIDGGDGRLYCLLAGRGTVGSLVVTLPAPEPEVEPKAPAKPRPAPVEEKTAAPAKPLLPTLELPQRPRPTVEALLATLDWDHVAQRHFHPGGPDRSRFHLADSNRETLLAFAREALEAGHTPVPNMDRTWLIFHPMGREIGEAQRWTDGQWVPSSLLVVRLSEDRERIVSLYPKSPF